MGESLGERRFPWEGPLRVSVVGESILVMGMWCPCKHLFFGLNVMGESRDCLEGVLSEEVRRCQEGQQAHSDASKEGQLEGHRSGSLSFLASSGLPLPTALVRASALSHSGTPRARQKRASRRGSDGPLEPEDGSRTSG